ncbi:MAG: MXAN_6640 family putative metalloprotease [Myxococcota bacterium]
MGRLKAQALALASAVLALASPADAQRPDTDPTLLFAFDVGDEVFRFDGEEVRVHYALEGANAVPSEDTDDTGAPDFVEMVARNYDVALREYARLGFRMPLPDGALGGDARPDVYLIDFGRSADGAFQRDGCATATCSGYMVQENDFAGYGYFNLDVAVRVVGSHELFHAIQAAYSLESSAVLSEGTATWGTEAVDPALGDFERAIFGFLSEPERPLFSMSATVLDRFSYGSALFFRFMEERYGTDAIVELLEQAEGVEWRDATVTLVEELDAPFAEVYADFVRWNLGTGQNDPDGYAEGARYPTVTPREVELPLEDERPRHFHAAARVYEAPLGARRNVRIELVNGAAPLHLIAMGSREGSADLASVVRSDDGFIELSLTDHDTLVFAVVNGASVGPSDRASVCAGTATETAACVAALQIEEDAGMPDGGMPDQGAGDIDAGLLDAGAIDAAPSDANPPDFSVGDAGMDGSGSGSGCSASGTPNLWSLLVLLCFVRRR